MAEGSSVPPELRQQIQKEIKTTESPEYQQACKEVSYSNWDNVYKLLSAMPQEERNFFARKELLERRGWASPIVRRIDLFTGFTGEELLPFIEKISGDSLRFVNLMFAFPELDRKKLFERMLEKEFYDELLFCIVKWVYTDLTLENAESLFEHKIGSFIPRWIDRFGGMTAEEKKKVILRVFQEEESREDRALIVSHVERYEGFSKTEALFFIENGFGYEVANHLWAYEGIDEEVFDALVEKGTVNQAAIHFFLPVLGERNIVRATFKIEEGNKDFPQIMLKHVLDSRHFDMCATLVDWGIVDVDLSSDEGAAIAQELEEAALPFQASSLLETLVREAIPVDEEVRQRLLVEAEQEQARRSHREKREVVTREVELLDELVEFYVNDFIRSRTQIFLENKELQQAHDRMFGSPLELSLRDRVALNDLNRARNHQTDELFRIMREYGVYAVNHITHHQAELEDPINDVYFSTEVMCIPGGGEGQGFDEHFLEFATDEEVREYLYRNRRRYSEKWGEIGYAIAAGAPWRAIIRTIESAWNPAGGKTKEEFIDAMVDLEHNNGMVFDKHPGQIHQNETEIKGFLDFKREAQTADEWLANLHNFVGGDVLDRLTARLNTLKRLEPKVEALVHKVGARRGEERMNAGEIN